MAFNIPNQTSYVLQRPVNPQPEWTRQPDWINVVDTPGEVQFVVTNMGLSSYTINTVFTQPLIQNLYIDWGDGNIDTISTNTATNTIHTYTTPGTPCSRGYDTYKVRVYVDAGARITTCSFGITPNQTNPNNPIGVLEAYYGDNTIDEPNQINFNSFSAPPYLYSYLEYVKLPAVMNGSSGFNLTFSNCRVISKIVMPTSAPNVISFNNTFVDCFLLQDIVLPSDATLVTGYTNTFSSCRGLTGATLPITMDLVTDATSMFSSCFALSTIKVPSMLSCTNYTSMFATCYSLITVEIPSFHSGATTITATTMFNNCRSLEYIKLPTTVTSGITFINTQMFNGCTNLKSCILPTNFDTTSTASMFASCNSLSSVTLPTSMPSLTDMNNMFSACFNLQEITLPTTIGATINMSSTFNGCTALSEVIVPSSYNINSLSNTFNGCVNIRLVRLPNNAQNSLTTMSNMCNGCNNLQSIILPTSMTELTNLSQAFINCLSLENLILPTTLNSVTTMNNMCAGCLNLKSITLPTSMPSITTNGLSGALGNCMSLKTITYPTTVNIGVNNYSLLAVNNSSLETLTLPTTQTTAVNSLDRMINNCPSLKTVNNLQFIGNPSPTTTVYIDGTNFSTGSYEFTGNADFYCKFSKLDMNGTSTIQSKLTSLRLRNNGSGQYGGTSPQINISYTNLNQQALVQVFTDLPIVTGKTINITGALGASSLTPAERTIATAKGWTITG